MQADMNTSEDLIDEMQVPEDLGRVVTQDDVKLMLMSENVGALLMQLPPNVLMKMPVLIKSLPQFLRENKMVYRDGFVRDQLYTFFEYFPKKDGVRLNKLGLAVADEVKLILAGLSNFAEIGKVETFEKCMRKMAKQAEACDPLVTIPFYTVEDIVDRIQNGELGGVKHCIENGADVTERTSIGSTALHWAAETASKHDVKIVEYIISAGAHHDIDAKRTVDGSTALHLAAKSSRKQIVGDSIQPYLAHTHRAKIVEMLLDAHASPNSKDKEGRTPLHLACDRGHAEVVRMLMAAEADPTIEDHKKQTPVHLAVLSGDLDTVRALKDFLVITKGDSPLHLAANEGNVPMLAEIVSLLGLHVVYMVSAENVVGETPLHQAVRSGILDAVKILLDAGSQQYDMKHYEDMIALAKKYRFDAIADLLAKAMADKVTYGPDSEKSPTAELEQRCDLIPDDTDLSKDSILKSLVRTEAGRNLLKSLATASKKRIPLPKHAEPCFAPLSPLQFLVSFVVRDMWRAFVSPTFVACDMIDAVLGTALQEEESVPSRARIEYAVKNMGSQPFFVVKGSAIHPKSDEGSVALTKALESIIPQLDLSWMDKEIDAQEQEPSITSLVVDGKTIFAATIEEDDGPITDDRIFKVMKAILDKTNRSDEFVEYAIGSDLLDAIASRCPEGRSESYLSLTNDGCGLLLKQNPANRTGCLFNKDVINRRSVIAIVPDVKNVGCYRPMVKPMVTADYGKKAFISTVPDDVQLTPEIAHATIEAVLTQGFALQLPGFRRVEFQIGGELVRFIHPHLFTASNEFKGIQFTTNFLKPRSTLIVLRSEDVEEPAVHQPVAGYITLDGKKIYRSTVPEDVQLTPEIAQATVEAVLEKGGWAQLNIGSELVKHINPDLLCMMTTALSGTPCKAASYKLHSFKEDTAHPRSASIE